MDNELRIIALEQVVKALIVEAERLGVDAHLIKQRAQGALNGHDGPGDPLRKGGACRYVEDLLGKK